MRSVFKWRVVTNKYLYITDGNPVEGSYPYGRPFLFNKKESKAYYSNEESTLLPTGVDDGKIQQFVGNINNENIYRDMYNTMVNFAKHLTTDKDVQSLTLDVDYKPYFNLDNDTCVIEAVTPKCEGYEPVFDFRVHTVDDNGNTQVVPYEFYPERNEHDKTLRYVLDFEVPKGEKGDPGNDGAGCKGDKGEQGDPGPTPFFTATATASEATGNTADVTVEVTPDTSTKPRTYNLDFKFEIPAGTPGDPGNDGNDGKDDVFTGITAAAERLGYDQVPYVRIYDDSSDRNVNRVKTIWNPEEIHDPDRGVDIDGRYESSFYMELGIPEGAPGIQGPEGRPSNIRIVDATVEETLEPGEQAQARAEVVRLESNNEYDIHLFFKIPRGRDGQDGTDGHDGQDTIRYNFSSEVIPDDTIDTITLDWDERFLPTENNPTIIEETLQLYYPSTWGKGVPTGGEEGQVLTSHGEGVDPTWEDLPEVQGVPDGGTEGQVLTSHGEGVDPTWEDLPEVGNGQLTIKSGNTTVGGFTANQTSNTEIKFTGSGGTTVSGNPSTGTINIETDTIPKVSNELIYSDDDTTLTTHPLMYTGGLVVDTPEDLALCESSADPDELILDVTPGENKVYEFNNSTWEVLNTTPLAVFLSGSRTAWNRITDKLFYNDGTNIYRITPKYTAGDNIEIDDTHKISAKIPKSENELIYFEDSNSNDPYKGLFTQQLMYEDGIVVDNQVDFRTCTNPPSPPNIQDTFQQFSESPYCPEYGNGLSLSQYAHVAPVWATTEGYGYGTWSTTEDTGDTGNTGNVISTDRNSQEFNGYIYPHNVHKIDVESLIGAYRGSTSGDIETITLLNTNHATPRCVRTTDGRTFYRNSMYDLEGSSENTSYCAWVYKPNNELGAYIIYSPSEAITSTDVDNGIYWTVTNQVSWDPSTGKLTKADAKTAPKGDGIGNNPAYLRLDINNNFFKDAFPGIGSDCIVYHASEVDTLDDRRNTTSTGTTVKISENVEASGYLAALNILINNASSIDNIFLSGNASICGTVMVYSEIIPISGVASPTKEWTDPKTLFSFVRTENSSTTDPIPSKYNGIDAYGLFPFKHQRRYFITVNKADCWTYEIDKSQIPYRTVYYEPSATNSLTSGNRLIPFKSSYDMNTYRTQAMAIPTKLFFQDGVIRLKFSKLGTSTSTGSLSTFENVDNFYEAGTEYTTKTPLNYTDAELTIDFRNRKYTMKDVNGNVVADNLDLVSYEDNLTNNPSDSIQRTGDTKYNVTVVENGVEKEVDVCSLFTEELQLMYSTTSVQYHALGCIFLFFNDKVILRADDNTVWKLDSDRNTYVRDTEHTALGLLKGSRMNFNDITKKLWYSNGSRIYQIGGSFS